MAPFKALVLGLRLASEHRLNLVFWEIKGEILVWNKQKARWQTETLYNCAQRLLMFPGYTRHHTGRTDRPLRKLQLCQQLALHRCSLVCASATRATSIIHALLSHCFIWGGLQGRSGWDGGGHRASVCSGFNLRGRKLFSFSFLSREQKHQIGNSVPLEKDQPFVL